ncbi:MAG: thiol oxidoreductase, partial [Deltaproteobacteria bacterium]
SNMKIYVLLGTLFFSLLTFANDTNDTPIDNSWLNTRDYRIDRPVGGLNDEEQDEFMLGRSFFSIPWVIAPSATTARDGLGPLFNANTCTSCHNGNGVGELYGKEGKISRAMVTKLTRKSGKPVPFYGKQIAVNGTVAIPFEAMPTRKNTPVEVTYPDGHQVTLQKPTYGLSHLNYGALPDDVIIVQRRAPALVGLGLIGDIDKKDLLKNADPDDKNNDGISGRPNWVIDANGEKKMGIYTAKAGVASVREQTADAANHDMGLTNPVFPEENCTPEQTACLQAPKGRPDYKGNTLDLTEQRLDAITAYLKKSRLPVQKLSETSQHGKSLFQSVGCVNCHIDTFTTKDGKQIAPYSDFLLHDMGEGLADGRTEFEASGSEFRTAPLWGLSTYAKTLKSKTPHYLHDGRAETVEQAILWHDGEAKAVKNRFMQLPKKEREAIFSFLNQL